MGGGVRLSQTSPIPRSPDGDKNDNLPGANVKVWFVFQEICKRENHFLANKLVGEIFNFCW